MQKRRRTAYHSGKRQICKNFVLSAFAVFGLFSFLLGAGLCLTKSPHTKSDYFLSLAMQYQYQAQDDLLQSDAKVFLLAKAQEALESSIEYQPYNAQAWQQISIVFMHQNKAAQAKLAQDISSQLGLNEMPTIMAMQAILPKRSLKLSTALLESASNNIVIQ